MPDEDLKVLFEVGQQLKAYLAFEQQMATPGVPHVEVSWPDSDGAERTSDLPGRASESISSTAVVAAKGRADAASVLPARPPAPTSAASENGELSPSWAPDPALSKDERVHRLRVLAEEAATCTDCVLHEKRHRNVFARGNPESPLVFVGEGPGRDEDQQGLPFVGAAGQLLDKMVAAMGFGRDDVYICNVVKCRPPDNRTPRPEEALACARFLRPQLALVRPQVIVALGRCAAEHLGVAGPEGPWRGRWGRYEDIKVMPTYHPAFLLRSPQFKRVVWEDLQKVMLELGRPAPDRDR